jgi:hypothetical protein
MYYSIYLDVKGEVYPINCHEGSEGEQRYSSTFSLTVTVNGGGWSVACPGHFSTESDPEPIV